MTKENGKRPSKQKTEADIQRIQDIYKQADAEYKGFGEAESRGLGDTNEPREIDRDQSNQRWLPKIASADHDWIVHALTDLADYAKNEGLTSVHETLKEAQLRVAGILVTEALSKRVKPTDPPKDDDS